MFGAQFCKARLEIGEQKHDTNQKLWNENRKKLFEQKYWNNEQQCHCKFFCTCDDIFFFFIRFLFSSLPVLSCSCKNTRTIRAEAVRWHSWKLAVYLRRKDSDKRRKRRWDKVILILYGTLEFFNLMAFLQLQEKR